jgi:phosphoribosylanthranilate isomerase
MILQSSQKTKYLKIDAVTDSALSRSGKAGVGIKICGMKYPENIIAVATLLPDYMGFIFWEKSARFFDGEMPNLPKTIKKVGVFVDASQEDILNKITKYDLQAIQLHGNESVEFCENLKRTVPNYIEIIKVFSILDTFDFKLLEPFEDLCDYFLFDTKGKLPGGNGTAFDWTVLRNYPSTKPFFLSGGIGAEEIDSVKEILKSNLPIYAIDVNSKFEIEPGLKNIQILSGFKRLLKP